MSLIECMFGKAERAH